MMKNIIFFFCLMIFLGKISQAQVKIHSHNDYTHQKPFFDAAFFKAYSIEADVFLIGDSLFVAHTKKEIKPGNTLEKLYLKPIKDLSKTKDFYSFQLMIDVKENWNAAYPVLLKQLNQYQKYFNKQGKKITIAISGNRPADSTFHNFPNFITFDGLPGHVYKVEDLKKVAMISDNFKTYSKWKGIGDISELDKQKLIDAINEAHKNGKPMRFWNAPDNPASWQLLHQLGADIINTDKVEEATEYFKKS